MSIREALESAGAEIGMDVPVSEPKVDPIEPEIEETDPEIESEEQDVEPKEAAQTKSPELEAQPKQPEQKEPEKALEASVESVEPPQFWSAERKALWSKVPVEAQKAVLEYENQRNAWANRIANEVAGVRQNQKQLETIIEPHASRLKGAGVTPIEAVDKLLRWSDALDDDSTRIQAFHRLLASYNLTPEHLLGQQVEQVDPVYSQLNSELSDLKKWKEEQEQQRAQQEQERQEQSLLSEVESVKAEKDERGNPKFPHLDFFAPHMASIIPNLQAANPHARPSEIVKYAYGEVAKQFPQFTQPAQPVQQVADKQRIERAQRATKANVSSRPTTEVPSRPKNAREALMEAAGELGLR